MCEPSEIMCKTSYPHVGNLGRIFSIHQVVKKFLQPNYLRITFFVIYRVATLHYFVRFIQQCYVTGIIMIPYLQKSKCKTEKDGTGIK